MFRSNLDSRRFAQTVREIALMIRECIPVANPQYGECSEPSSPDIIVCRGRQNVAFEMKPLRMPTEPAEPGP